MAEAAMTVATVNISSDGSNKGGNSDSDCGCLDGSGSNGSSNGGSKSDGSSNA